MQPTEQMRRELEDIVSSGITHTQTVIDLLFGKWWPNDLIVPVIYQLVLAGKLSPQGIKIPYRGN